MARRRSLSLAALALGLSTQGCVGSINGDDVAGGPGPSGNGTGPGNGGLGNTGSTGGGQNGGGNGNMGGTSGGGPAPDPTAAGPTPLRRLDRREYNNTVRDLLGDNTSPADKFPSDHQDDFNFRRAGIVSTQDYSTVRDAAEALAAAANVNMLAPCTTGAAAAEEACAKKFATNFGLRAYRRPLTTAEVDSLMTLYRDGRAMAMADYAGGIKIMLEGILQSPSFLYHWEGGPAAPVLEGKVIKLNDYENASHLSYFLWGSMPDQALFDLAAAKKLNTAADLEAQARRMLSDPKARDTVGQFLEEWMGLDAVLIRQKDLMMYPEFKDDQVKAAMIGEARTFLEQVVFDGDGLLSTALTANYSFVNQPLAPIYGKTASGMDFQKMDLDPAQRSGLFTQPGFLTVTGATNGSNPVKRGRKIFEGMLCGELPPPPANVPLPKPASAGGTTRERFAEHSAQACAAGCHVLMDPIGYAFENFDGIGKYRTMDNGGKVDASTEFEIDGKVQPFNGARELAQILAKSPKVQKCFSTQWLRFAFKRKETDGDAASIAAITAAFAKNGNNIRDLLVGVAASRTFRYRAPAQGEMLQ
jgi:Protein of unknown function (DUF1592)/Protein of unknown function (DUF1588)/Protein of unknown function (DUF1595)/Protein of unknown function (DUF1585)/Protein of unknown function (DUF1587)